MIEAAPEDYELKFALAGFYLDGKEPAKAKAVYQGIINKENLGPAGLSARDRLASLRLQENDLAGARARHLPYRSRQPRSREESVGAIREFREPVVSRHLRLGALQARRRRGLCARAEQGGSGGTRRGLA
jgi:hypothetical protein